MFVNATGWEISMRRTKEQTAETRRTILKSAERLFLEQGYENVSLDEIAAASGLTRGAVHWHFHNKRGLLFAIRDETGLPIQELADRLSEGDGVAGLETLADITTRILGHLQADPGQRNLLRMLSRLDDAVSADGADTNNDFSKKLETALVKIFAAVERAGGLRPPWTAASAARAYNAAVSGLVNEWARGKVDFDLVPDADAIVRALLIAWRAQ
jgi:TetR/AcrR family acrAB operon transcriptional repressor